MSPLRQLGILLYFLIEISEQLVLPTVPTLPDLPTPQQFLENLFNATTKDIKSIVSAFTFDEVLTDDIQFLLYSNDGLVATLNESTDSYHIDNSSEPIKIIIHGYLSSGDADFVKDMAKSYHSIGINNVIAVDWSHYSKKIYPESAKATKRIGEIVGDFIMNIIRNDTTLLKNVHLIGHSLGAQISGFASQHLQNVTDGLKVERITGLDVAGPLFEFPLLNPSRLRLDSKDGYFVDCIHTNKGFFGFAESLGDADYYVNFGGPIQPACVSLNVIEALVCSHSISHDYFNRTITSTDYLATSCENAHKAKEKKCNNNEKVIMGEHTEKTATGNYYISIDKNYLPN